MSVAILLGVLLAAAPVVAAPVLVDTDWLAEHIDDSGVVVLDMTSDDLQYTRFHIPGAIRLGYADIVQRRKRDKVAVRLEDAVLVKLLGQLGIRRDDHVVIYDDVGGLDAGRLFWDLERIGHPQVSVLDGGLVTWILEGRKVSNEPVRRVPVAYDGDNAGRDNVAELPEVLRASSSGDALLLDVRTIEEYVGDRKYPRSGHVPRALWWPWEDNVDLDHGFVLKDEAGISNVLRGLGAQDKEQSIILYCRSGHRAAQSYLTLRALNYENVKLYDASMAEYARQPGAPLVQGKRPCQAC